MKFWSLAMFWFVLLGSKLVLGAIVMHMLLPKDRECAVCNAETLPLESPRAIRPLLKLLRVQRYWCMECDRQSLGRPGRLAAGARDVPLVPVSEVRLR
jgi:hypothetical protein